jgi:hypothetical protein
MLLAMVLPWNLTALALIGFGNALIHISGAVYTLQDTNGEITPNAIFVGGGSFGVITGQLLGGLHIPQLMAIPITMLTLGMPPKAVLDICITCLDPIAKKLKVNRL